MSLMKVVILAGGLGTRLAEETELRPKPLVTIGEKPIIWHIMKYYSHFGYNEFVVCLGHKGHMIKEYFRNLAFHNSDLLVDTKTKKIQILKDSSENWKIHLINTGQNTMTGGRLRRVREYVGDGTFCLTYGDGLANVDLKAAYNSHLRSGKPATVTATNAPPRFGGLEVVDEEVVGFSEKTFSEYPLINGGFFFLEKEVFNFLDCDETIWEQEPLKKLAKNRLLNHYKHDGFFQPMDTIRDKQLLEELLASGKAPWVVW